MRLQLKNKWYRVQLIAGAARPPWGGGAHKNPQSCKNVRAAL